MASFRMNPTFLPRLAASPEVGAMLLDGARAVAERAKDVAPVASGAYRDSIHAELVVENGIVKARVVADDPTGAAGLIEFGTVDTPAFAPLRRGLEAVFGLGALVR